MKIEILFIAIITVTLSSCSSQKDPQIIIDKAIVEHGGDQFATANISFAFREKQYTSYRLGGQYTYTRTFEDSTGLVIDVLNNEGFTRTINGDTSQLPAKLVNAYSNSVNSVIYFAVLPYGLNDPAVKKEYAGETIINDKKYDVIMITFDQAGGGDDHEDRFIYWINTETHRMDYLAYSFLNAKGNDVRFREAVNPRVVNGIVFQDYINYKPKNMNELLEQIEELYKNHDLEILSKIELENIRVQPI